GLDPLDGVEHACVQEASAVRQGHGQKGLAAPGHLAAFRGDPKDRLDPVLLAYVAHVDLADGLDVLRGFALGRGLALRVVAHARHRSTKCGRWAQLSSSTRAAKGTGALARSGLGKSEGAPGWARQTAHRPASSHARAARSRSDS